MPQAKLLFLKKTLKFANKNQFILIFLLVVSR